MVQGRLSEATRLLGEAVSADPRDAHAWNALGVALVRQGEVPRGTDALARAVDVAPGFAEARRNLAVALDRHGRGREAVRHYRAFLEHAAPDALARADVRRRLGELEAAEAAR